MTLLVSTILTIMLYFPVVQDEIHGKKLMNPQSFSLTSSEGEPDSSRSENELNQARRLEDRSDNSSDESPPTKRKRSSPTPKIEGMDSDVSTSPEMKDLKMTTRDESYKQMDQGALWTMAHATTKDKE